MWREVENKILMSTREKKRGVECGGWSGRGDDGKGGSGFCLHCRFTNW